MNSVTEQNFLEKGTAFLRFWGPWILGLTLWTACVGYGFSRLLLYEAAPGKVSLKVLEVWPQNSGIPAPSSQPVLLMFAHPQCPCTRASISELEKMMVSLQGRAQVYVYFVTPNGFSESQVKDALWKKTEKIPGVRVFLDAANQEAARFGSKVSGETFVYGKNGDLLFHGGVTRGRGHEGPNAGSEAVTRIIFKGEKGKAGTRVFGCSLWDRHTRKDADHGA